MDIIGNVRLVEDSVAFVLLTIVLCTLANAAIRLHGVPIRFVSTSLMIALLPFYIWKGLGSMRRAFVDKATAPELYTSIHDIGEIFETVSGFAIAVGALYLVIRLRKLYVKAS